VIPRQTTGRTSLALAFITVALHLPLVTWGLPHATAPERVKTFATDEILPLEGLAEMRSTFVRAAADRNFGYPWWHYAVVSAAQAPYLGVLWLSGDLTAPDAEYPFGLRDPVRSLRILTILGRLVSVFMTAGIVIASFRFARALWGHSTGVVAGILTMVSYPLFYYGHTGNLDTPMFFWSACGLAVFATIIASGLTMRRAAWLGVLAALGMATKDQAAVLFVPTGAVLLFPQFNNTASGKYPVRPIVVLLGAGLLTYAAATALLIDPARHFSHVHAILFEPTRVSDAASYFALSPRTWSGTVALLSDFGWGLVAMMSWPVLLAAAGGFILAVRSDRRHLLWLLPFVMTFLVLVRLPGLLVMRYLMPLTLFVDAFAAVLLVRSGALRQGVRGMLLVLLIGWRAATCTNLAYEQLRDTRYAAADWLRTNYQTGERLEYFGGVDKLPAMDAHVNARRIMGREDYANESGRAEILLDYLAKDGPTYVVVIPDWTSQGAEHGKDCPPEVFEALENGQAGYQLVAHFRSPGLLPPPLQRPALDYPTVAPPVRIFRKQ
jgi:hypothetical protein